MNRLILVLTTLISCVACGLYQKGQAQSPSSDFDASIFPAPLPAVAEQAADLDACIANMFNETSGSFEEIVIVARSNGEFSSATGQYVLEPAGDMRWKSIESIEGDNGSFSVFLTLKGEGEMEISEPGEDGAGEILYTTTFSSCTDPDPFGRWSYASHWIDEYEDGVGRITRSGILSDDEQFEKIVVERDSGAIGATTLFSTRLAE